MTTQYPLYTEGLLPTSTSLVGQKSKSPQTKSVTNTIDSKDAVPKSNNTTSIGTGSKSISVDTAPKFDPNTAYQNYTQRLGNFNSNQDPGVLAAQERQRNFENSYADVQAAHSTQPNPFGYQSNLMGLAGARYAQLAPLYTAQVGQAQTGAGQTLGALTSATSASAPRQQGYALLNPFNNQPAGSGGSGNGLGALAPLVYAGGRLDAAAASGGQSIPIDSAIQNARGIGQQFSSLIAKDPTFNSGSFVWGNALNQLLSGTFSSPTTPGIQSAFNNTISQYAQIFPGGEAAVQNLIKAANPPSMQALLKILDDQAQTIRNTNQTVGIGGGVTAPAPSVQSSAPQNLATPPPQSFKRKDGSIVHLQSDGTYQ